ncbi:PREDICTED: uncharacterized protein LOC104804846 [Tarenaya hassleriana]|uniref:uncharacterized protein LOC104804846 n=1 Tax=Tarenaya hassleriana TaxID=28532 RepID=UPI00053C98A5|nr:PREDICTED: uncharacterized protein LOC104804846 [Tarenaya hassleriana]
MTTRKTRNRHNPDYTDHIPLLKEFEMGQKTITDLSPYTPSAPDPDNTPRFLLPSPEMQEHAGAFYQVIRNTKFASMEISRLGLYDSVRELCAGIHWESLLHMREDTYRQLTAEFLGSFRLFIPPTGEAHRGYMAFWIADQQYRLTMAQFADILGVPHGATAALPFIHPDRLKAFWRDIGSKHFKLSLLKSTWIRHPTVRYFHMLLAHVVFVKTEPGGLNQTELLFIRYALSPIYGGDDWGMGQVDIASRVALHLHQIARSNSGVYVRCGGLVTTIARRVRVNVGRYVRSRLKDATVLDLAALRSKFSLETIRGNHLWLYYDQQGTSQCFTFPNIHLPPISIDGLRFQFSAAQQAGLEEGAYDGPSAPPSPPTVHTTEAGPSHMHSPPPFPPADSAPSPATRAPDDYGYTFQP